MQVLPLDHENARKKLLLRLRELPKHGLFSFDHRTSVVNFVTVIHGLAFRQQFVSVAKFQERRSSDWTVLGKIPELERAGKLVL